MALVCGHGSVRIKERRNKIKERDLMCAVIAKAIEDARINPEIFTTKQLRDEAERNKNNAIKWISSKNKEFMSFEWYCDLLDFSSNSIRNKVIGKNHKILLRETPTEELSEWTKSKLPLD